MVVVEQLLPVGPTARHGGILTPNRVGKDLDPTIHENSKSRRQRPAQIFPPPKTAENAAAAMRRDVIAYLGQIIFGTMGRTNCADERIEALPARHTERDSE